jgi:hypothetical protein
LTVIAICGKKVKANIIDNQHMGQVRPSFYPYGLELRLVFVPINASCMSSRGQCLKMSMWQGVIMWLWLIAGIAIGWLIEWVIDWSFWRPSALNLAPSSAALKAELETTKQALAKAQQKIAEQELRIRELEQLEQVALSK